MSESKSKWRWLRLGVCLLSLFTLSLWWEVRQVEAEFSERSLSFGRSLEKLSELERNTTTFELNGERMTLTTTMRDEPASVLLDRFASLCARDSGGVSEQLDELAAKGAQIPAPLRAFGVFRADGQDEGTAACFARKDGGGLLETIKRLELLLDDGDFSRLGQLRYMFTRKALNGQSHVISVSSLGQLRLARMFPAHGDAPGSDLIDSVRPPAARRVLSVRVEGSQLQTAMYESRAEPELAVSAFDPAMRARGFSSGDLRSVQDSLVAATRVFLREDQTVLVLARPRADHLTAVSTFRLQGGGFSRQTMPFAMEQP